MDRWRHSWAGGLWPRGVPTTWLRSRLESPLFHAMQARVRNVRGFWERVNYSYCHTRFVLPGLDCLFHLSLHRGEYSSKCWLAIEDEANECSSQLPRESVIDL